MSTQYNFKVVYDMSSMEVWLNEQSYADGREADVQVGFSNQNGRHLATMTFNGMSVFTFPQVNHIVALGAQYAARLDRFLEEINGAKFAEEATRNVGPVRTRTLEWNPGTLAPKSTKE